MQPFTPPGFEQGKGSLLKMRFGTQTTNVLHHYCNFINPEITPESIGYILCNLRSLDSFRHFQVWLFVNKAGVPTVKF